LEAVIKALCDILRVIKKAQEFEKFDTSFYGKELLACSPVTMIDNHTALTMLWQ
jgi:hypothetical protein